MVWTSSNLMSISAKITFACEHSSLPLLAFPSKIEVKVKGLLKLKKAFVWSISFLASSSRGSPLSGVAEVLHAVLSTLMLPFHLLMLTSSFSLGSWVPCELLLCPYVFYLGHPCVWFVTDLCGVRQDSALEQLLFTMYTSALSTIVSPFGNISHHMYAYDTQV